MKRITRILMGLVLSLFLVVPAYAIPTMEVIINGGAPIIIQDNIGAADLNPTLGIVSVLTGGGGWTLNITTGSTKPAATWGTASKPIVDINTIQAFFAPSGTVPTGTVRILFGDTDYTAANFAGTFQIGGTLGGTGSVTSKAYYDNANGILIETALFTNGTLGPITTTPFSLMNNVSGATDNLYSLTLDVLLTATNSFNTSLDTELQVPEPISLILLGSGLVGAGLYRRLRRRS